MHYTGFTIQNYRAIVGPLTVNLEKNKLIPIIGVNESGKTTILHAIFSFDSYNDKANGGIHLEDTENLYSSKQEDPQVSASIQITKEEWINVIEEQLETKAIDDEKYENLTNLIREPIGQLNLTRNLKTRLYSFIPLDDCPLEQQNKISLELIANLPYILYFDDFQDKVEERIGIPKDKTKETDWFRYMNRLFSLVIPNISIYDLKGMDDRRRKTILGQVKEKFNATLTKEWAKFRLDEVDALTIGIEFEDTTSDTNLGFLKLEVIERTTAGDHYFYIRNRSKGFYWFVNFVTKLEFNDKAIGDASQSSIYLLDEPGSYLHSSAQAKLCKKLSSLSIDNCVIYCTHSHYLLNPNVVPFRLIQIAEKDKSGGIKLAHAHEHKSPLSRHGAFQPIIDALEIQDFDLDRNATQILIVEGICDYFALQMFKTTSQIGILPATNADSIRYHISEMLLKQRDFKVLWDNDNQGRQSFEKAKHDFGDEIAKRHFKLLGLKKSTASKFILQDLFDGRDMKMIKLKLELANNTSFEKVIAALFYSKDKKAILNCLTGITKQNFAQVFEYLGFN